MSTVVALDSSQITKIGVGVTIALVVLGILLSLIITAVVGRILILVVVVALGILVWQQRSSIEDHLKKCQLDMSFLGVHVKAPKDVTDKCAKVSHRPAAATAWGAGPARSGSPQAAAKARRPPRRRSR